MMPQVSINIHWDGLFPHLYDVSGIVSIYIETVQSIHTYILSFGSSDISSQFLYLLSQLNPGKSISPLLGEDFQLAESSLEHPYLFTTRQFIAGCGSHNHRRWTHFVSFSPFRTVYTIALWSALFFLKLCLHHTQRDKHKHVTSYGTTPLECCRHLL